MNEKIFFAHANGFPSEVYSDLFEDLKGFDIGYIPMLAHGKHQIKKSWRAIIPEIIDYVDASSSLETNKKKDKEKIKDFLIKVKEIKNEN